MKLDSISNQVYIVAKNEAKLKSHEYVTPEHFLYATLMFNAGADIIENSGGSTAGIQADLEKFFDEHIEKVDDFLPIESFAFIKLFEIAAVQAANSEKNEITIGDLLAAMMTLQESFAVYIMKKNGTDRLALLKYISFGLKEKERLQNAASKTEAQAAKDADILRMYSVNLTDKARRGQLDPVVGREDILERTVMTLCRRLKNNPVHVGDAGVGKTAIVAGLAQRIASGNVPEKLKNAQIFEIDMAMVVAGTKYRGDFEERLIKILEAAAAAKDAIIYFDEIHNIVGAGSVSSGGMDAGGILKPYLARGALRFIGATTHDEFKKHFEKDSALARRFQRIDIDEPSVDDSIKILEGIKAQYEVYHNVQFPPDIIRVCCELSGKFINDRRLPDKAIDVLDETGALIRMHTTKKSPVTITVSDIERTVAKMAKIPVNTVSVSETKMLADLSAQLKERVFGQDAAADTIANAIKASRSGLNDPEKPVASLLFVGPTGVGKTEIARQLASLLNVKLIRFDMSEYQEQHSVARLIGSPPGYVGYENGGLLTDEIRKTPHCVLLLDEIEKAHQDVFNVLLAVMDYGVLTDNTGKKADFRNVILIMTSNAGARDMGKRIIGFDDSAYNTSAIDKEVERVFSPEFRNRLDEIIPFNHIDSGMALLITKKALSQLSERVRLKGFELQATDESIRYISERGLSKSFGAREIVRLIDKEIRQQLANLLLFGEEGDTLIRITLQDNALKLTRGKD